MSEAPFTSQELGRLADWIVDDLEREKGIVFSRRERRSIRARSVKKLLKLQREGVFAEEYGRG